MNEVSLSITVRDYTFIHSFIHSLIGLVSNGHYFVCSFMNRSCGPEPVITYMQFIEIFIYM